MDSTEEIEEGLLQTVAVADNATKKSSKREELHILKAKFFKQQSVLFETFHSIVLPPIICVTLADLHGAIKNGSFDTLLQLLKTFMRCKIPQQCPKTPGSIWTKLSYFSRQNPNRAVNDEDQPMQQRKLEELRKQASSFLRKKKEDQPAELNALRTKFVLIIEAFKPWIQLGPEDLEVSDVEQWHEAANKLIVSLQRHLEEWCARSDITEVHELFEELNKRDDSRTIAEPKTLLQNAKTHGALAIMLKRSDIFRPFLKVILEQFNAFNEQIQPDLDSPLHYAVRNLDDSFLQWLLNQQSLDINIRNKQKKTVLFFLCEQYDSVRQKIKNHGKNDDQEKLYETLLKYRSFIENLLDRGANMNICSSKALLPYELLTGRNFGVTSIGNQLVLQEQEFFNRCDELLQRTGNHVVLKRFGKIKEFPIENFGEITVELLEIFLRFKEEALFKDQLHELKLKEVDERKVIRFLLHPAVELNMSKSVEEILKHCGEQIFATAQDKSSELKYRVELKGLLHKACDSANKDTLARLVNCMDKDRMLINDECILVYTLNRCKTLSDDKTKNNLLECAQWMASDRRVFQSRRDCYGNTALHVALKYEFIDVAKSLLSNSKFVYLGVRNNKSETPMTYATYEFYKAYLDGCIKTVPGSGPKGDVLIDLEGINPFAIKKSKEKKDVILPKIGAAHDSDRRSFSSMDCVKSIADSKDHRQLLYHPVIYTFILIEWFRYSSWHIANLLLTFSTCITFGYYSLDYICNGHFSLLFYVFSWCGVACVFTRELLQWAVFGKQYLWTLQNWLDIANILGMILVLTFFCSSVVSALSIIILAIQLIQLIGSLPFNTISTYRTMFRMVAINVIKSLALFSPLLIAFAYSFYVIYNDTKPSKNTTTGNASDDSQFNKFGSASTAGVKILVMATGEFEAAQMNIDGKSMIIFLLFLFCVPMVIQNLINGLAISDVAEIRSQSESISLMEKVQLLAQFEAGLSRTTCKPVRKVLDQLQKLSPAQFFRAFSSKIKISIDDCAKIMIKPLHSKLNKHATKSPAALNNVAKESEESSKDCWKTLPRIPGLDTFVATLNDSIAEELLLIGNQNTTNISQRTRSSTV